MANSPENRSERPGEEQLALQLGSLIREMVNEATGSKKKPKFPEEEPEEELITDEFLLEIQAYIDERSKYKQDSKRLNERDEEMLERIMIHAEEDRIISAEAFIALTNELTKDIQKSDRYPFTPLVLEQLQDILTKDDYDELGGILTEQVKRRAVSLKTFKESISEESSLANASDQLLLAMTSRYIRGGFVKITDSGKLSMTKQGRKQEDVLSTHSIERAEWIHGLIMPEAKPERTIEEIYAEYSQEAKVDRLEIKTKRKGAKVLVLSELLIGNKDSDVAFFTKVVEKINSLTAEEQPDVIIMSGVLQGDFKYWQKRRRASLVPEFSDMERQLEAARAALNQLLFNDIQLVYNLSNDDRRIAEEYSISTIKELYSSIESLEELSYYQTDQIMQHPSWFEIRRFYIEYGMPYMLRTGRELDENSFLMMKDYVRKMQNGEDIGPEYGLILDLDSIHIPGIHEVNDFIITDDVDITIKAGRDITDWWVRHNWTFSDEPMYQGHLAAPMDTIGQLEANGEATPDALILEHQQEMVGIIEGDTWILQSGGFTDTSNFVRSKASTTSAPGDISRRAATTRRRMSTPAASMHEFTNYGSHIIDIYDELLMEKSDSTEQIALAWLADLQTGSNTARHEAQVLAIDHILTHTVPNFPTIFMFGGDQIQGRNYPNFPNENENIGLISMDSQTDFVEKMLLRAFTNSTPENINNIIEFNAIPGNHEWNSGTTKWHGYSFTKYLKSTFEKIYLTNGILDAETRAKQILANQTPSGDQMKNWTVYRPVGDYGFLLQHMPLERGAKGASGPPVFQGHTAKKGMGELWNNVDIAEYGHWHHAQYALFEHKLMVVSSALATLSPYEYMRGYNPQLGTTITYVGGSKPVRLEFLTKDTLFNHQIKGGFFSNKNLKKNFGLVDDEGFNPYSDGMYTYGRPKSALQKALWQLINDVRNNSDNVSYLGRERDVRSGRRTGQKTA